MCGLEIHNFDGLFRIGRRSGMKRAMGGASGFAFGLERLHHCSLCHEGFAELVVDVCDGYGRWMQHVGGIKPIVAQVVHHYLVGGKV